MTLDHGQPITGDDSLGPQSAKVVEAGHRKSHDFLPIPGRGVTPVITTERVPGNLPLANCLIQQQCNVSTVLIRVEKGPPL